MVIEILLQTNGKTVAKSGMLDIFLKFCIKHQIKQLLDLINAKSWLRPILCQNLAQKLFHDFEPFLELFCKFLAQNWLYSSIYFKTVDQKNEDLDFSQQFYHLVVTHKNSLTWLPWMKEHWKNFIALHVSRFDSFDWSKNWGSWTFFKGFKITLTYL